MSQVTNANIADSLRYTNLMLEQVLGQNQAIFEVVVDMQGKVARIPKIEEDISELKADMKTVKLAVRDTNRDLHKLESVVYGAV